MLKKLTEQNTNLKENVRENVTKTIYSEEELNELFPIVDVKSFSFKDSFLKHEPESANQKRVKETIVRAIESNDSINFRKPAIDPSVDDQGSIYFKKGSTPGINYSVNWWNAHVKDFMPSKKSRIGTLKEYDLFIGTIIKFLVEEKDCKIYEAWRRVCDDSYLLGNYFNNPTSKHVLEQTGSLGIGKWLDLANTFKIISKDGGSHDNLIAGGCYCSDSRFTNLADIRRVCDYETEYWHGTGWIVLDV